jgi:hypothetical protein
MASASEPTFFCPDRTILASKPRRLWATMARRDHLGNCGGANTEALKCAQKRDELFSFGR